VGVSAHRWREQGLANHVLRQQVKERKATLRKCERVIAALALEAWIARIVTRLASSEECLECQIDTNRYVLKDLGMHRIKRRMLLFQHRERRLLLVERESFAGVLIGVLALFQQMIIQPTVLFQGLVEFRCCFLLGNIRY
jgi:hypothetical protein